MKRLVIVGCATLLLAGIGNAATGPSLRVASTKPFVVRGAHFKARERVHVTVASTAHVSTHAVRATVGGSFSASFATARIDRCSAYVVRAAGSHGDSAVLRHRPLPQCPPASAP